MSDQDRWHELTEVLTNSEAEYRRMALETFAHSHDPMNAFRWQQRAEGREDHRGGPGHRRCRA